MRAPCATCHKRLAPRTLTIIALPIKERSLWDHRPITELNLSSLTFQLSSSTLTRPLEKKNPRIRIVSHPSQTKGRSAIRPPAPKPRGFRLGSVELSARPPPRGSYTPTTLSRLRRETSDFKIQVASSAYCDILD